MEASGNALCGSHHCVRTDDRRHVPSHSPGTTMAGVLSDSLPQRARNLAELPFAAGLGFLRDQYLSPVEPIVPRIADDPGLCVVSGSRHGLAKESVWAPEPWLAGNAETMA